MHPDTDDLVLEIGSDPTAWVLEEADAGAVREQLKQDSGPIVLQVTAPLRGRLVLSPNRAGAISFHGAHPIGHPAHGAHPIGHPARGEHPIGASPRGPHPIGDAPLLYLPWVTAAIQGSPVYVLDAGTDLEETERDIIAAMTKPTRLALPIVERDIITATTDDTAPSLHIDARSGSGHVVLNGEALAFAVLARFAA